LIEIINKQLLLQLVGYLCYWQMGFNSVFKGLNIDNKNICKVLKCITNTAFIYLRNLAFSDYGLPKDGVIASKHRGAM